MKKGCLAIIPARGGSKRIKRKNIKAFIDKPIVSFSIELAINSGLFTEVMVSTDDNEIAKISKNSGAIIPFVRSAKNADDHATTSDVIIEVILFYKEQGVEFDYICCIYPTAPLISISRIKEAFIKIKNNDFDVVFPVMKFSFPIQRALKLEGNNIEMISKKHEKTRSQDLMDTYHDAGQFYWLKPEELLSNNTILPKKSGCIELTEMEGQDIDNLSDWEIAEFKYKYLNDIL